MLLFFPATLLQAQNGDWIRQSPPVTQNLNDIVVSGSGIITAVGDQGTICKSIDGGDSWVVKNSGTYNNLMALDFSSSSIGYAVGTGGVILKTTDSGESWAVLNSGVTTNLLGVSFADNNTGWATGFNRTVIKTTDGGATWIPQYSAATLTFLEDVKAINLQRVMAVGWGSGDFNGTTDGGQTWSGTDLAGWAKGVDFMNDTVGWVAGITASYISVTESWGELYTTINGKKATLWKTINGGSSWSPLVFSSNAQWLYEVAVVSPTRIVAVGEKGLIASTTDGGLNWNLDSNPAFSAISFNAVVFESATTGYIAGNNGTLLKTENGGVTWTPKGISGTTNHLTSVSFVNKTTGWAAGYNGTLIKTSDGGKNWIPQPSGLSSNTIHSVFFTDSLTGWCTANEGTILNTTNGGNSWTPQNSGTTTYLYSVRFTDKNNGWVAGWNGTILHTSDGGQTWVPQLSGTNAFLHTVFFVNSTTGWAGGDNGTLLLTRNGGLNWTKTTLVTSETASTIKDLYFLDEKTGWCVGDWILKTTDGGETWVKQFGNMSEFYGYSSLNSIFFVNSHTGYISAWNGKILKTTDGGASWGIASTGNTSPYSDLWFTDSLTGWIAGNNGYIMKTESGGGTFMPMEYLNIPTLEEPSDGKNYVSLSPVLRWNSAGQGSTYEVLLVTDDIHYMDSIISDISGVTDTFLVLDKKLQPDKRHEWKVRLIGSSGATGNWSGKFSFKTQPIPDCIPTLSNPYGYDVSGKYKVSFRWYCAFADSFRVQVSTDPAFLVNMAVDSAVQSTEVYLLLNHSSTYYWRVKQIWGTSPREWSEPGSFTTPEKIPYIYVQSPAGYNPSLAKGTLFRISWEDNFDGALQVTLIRNSTPVSVLGYTSSNSYDWSISDATETGENFRIMLKDTTSGFLVYSIYFTIDNPQIRINQPEEGQNWAKGTRQYISWSDNIPYPLFLTLYKGSANIGTIGYFTDCGQLGYYWDISDFLVSGSDYRIEIRDTLNRFSAFSGFFTIESLFISVTAPFSGDRWGSGSDNNWITWEDNVPNSLVLLLYKGDLLQDTIGFSNGAHFTTYNWEIPASVPAGMDYRIVVMDTVSQIYSSSSIFSIEDPFIVITNPSSGTKWYKESGSKYIFWNDNIPRVLLILLFKGEQLIQTIGRSESRYQTSYAWVLPGSIEPGTDYRIAVQDTLNHLTAYSSYFTILDPGIVPPDVPLLASPVNFSANQSVNLTLSWNPSAGADHYTLQVSDKPDFSSSQVIEQNLTITTKEITSLSVNTVYYWRVRAVNLGGASKWSNVWIFDTMEAVGMDDRFSNPRITVYPNPSSGRVTILTGPLSSSGAEFRLYEPSGKLVASRILVSPRTWIDLSALTHGLYVAEIRSGPRLSRLKLIIQ